MFLGHKRTEFKEPWTTEAKHGIRKLIPRLCPEHFLMSTLTEWKGLWLPGDTGAQNNAFLSPFDVLLKKKPSKTKVLI